MNLKLYLLVQIILVAFVCLITTAGYVLYQANQQARQESRMLADSLTRHLEAQLLRIDANIEHAARYPDFDLWKQTHMRAGMCIRYRSTEPAYSYDLCQGENSVGKSWPGTFEKIYLWLFTPSLEISRSITFMGRDYGSISVLPNLAMELAKAWDRIIGLLGLSVITVIAVCLLVTTSIYRALRPVQVIVDDLAKMQDSDSIIRLPAFKLAEWQRIGIAINDFSATRQHLLAERKMLVLKLIALQEEERRYLSRELHDELGQCLAAINAIAASIAQTALQDCPSLVAEAESISHINQRIMTNVRSLLVRLRPAEIDDLGLEACLNTMIGELDRLSSGRIRYQLTITGDCQSLKASLAITLYRIIQEGLTNVVKHSSATSVLVALDINRQHIMLAITDNGKIAALPFTENQGIGLLGIRERVTGLGGQLHLEIAQSGGLLLRVELPNSVNTMESLG